MATNPYFTYSIQGEQDLHESLVIEQIKMFGKDVYYIPRTLVKEDHTFGEDTLSRFNGAFAIEAYIANTTGFGGDGELYSKFGLRITDQMEFVISRKRFTEAVDNNTALIVEGRPNEGDLIWFPLAKKLFQINFVEYESPFYEFGKNFVWNLKTEIFEYSDEKLDTGVPEIDAVETTRASSMKLVMDPGGVGHYTVGESVRGTGNDANVAYTHSDWTLGFTVWDGGEGYDPNDPPTITFSAPPEGGTQATGIVQVNSSGMVTGVTLYPGSGYTSAPSFVLEPSPIAVSAEVKSWNPVTRELEIINRNGTFTAAESIRGLTSNALWSPQTYNTIDNTNSEYDDNKYYEESADSFLDFTERNPFGEIGNFGSSV